MPRKRRNATRGGLVKKAKSAETSHNDSRAAPVDEAVAGPSIPPVSVYLSPPLLLHRDHTRDYEGVGGITCLGNEIFVARHITTEVEVYDVETLAPKRCFPVPGISEPWDLASSEHNNSIYVADLSGLCVFRVEIEGNITKWSVEDKPFTISVANNNNIFVTTYFSAEQKVKEYTPDGLLVRVISFEAGMENLLHTIQLPNGEFLVSHKSEKQRVCIADQTGCVKKSFGGKPGSRKTKMEGPEYLAADEQGMVLVADRENHRILLLSPSLIFIRELISEEGGKLQGPQRMHLDQARGRLLIGDDYGQISVFKVKDT